MARSKGADKKNKRRKSSKKEVEIPVYFVEKKASEEEEEKDFSPKIIKDEDDLPVFERAPLEGKKDGKNIFTSEEEAAEEINKIKKEAREKKSIETEKEKEFLGGPATRAMSPARKKTMMWASVAVISAIVFFSWIIFLGKQLSLNFSPRNSFIIEDSGEVEKIKERFGELKTGWSKIQEIAGEKKSLDTERQALEKIKEKILLEEMKNKLEN